MIQRNVSKFTALLPSTDASSTINFRSSSESKTCRYAASGMTSKIVQRMHENSQNQNKVDMERKKDKLQNI